MTDSNAKGGQVSVNHTGRNFGTSITAGGQVPVRSSVEGVRGSNWNARGAVSPLGGVSNSTPGDLSKREENAERPDGKRF